MAVYFLMANPVYLVAIWHDPSGQRMLATAFGMQVIAVCCSGGCAQPMTTPLHDQRLLLLGAALLLLFSLLDQRRRSQQISRRLEGNLLRQNRFGNLLQVLGDSKVGQRSVKIDNETQALLNRLGWRSARQRSLFAACQIGSPLLLLALTVLLQAVFFPAVEKQWIAPLFALGVGYLLPKRLLVIAVARRQKQLASEIGTFIPLLRILFESGMA